jgi:hypothetical protein
VVEIDRYINDNIGHGGCSIIIPRRRATLSSLLVALDEKTLVGKVETTMPKDFVT